MNRFRIHRLHFEHLEVRRLLAVTTEVLVPAGPFAVGQKVSYTIQIANSTSERADDIRVVDDISRILDDVTWSRVDGGYSGVVEESSLTSHSFVLDQESEESIFDWIPTSKVDATGDANGDGINDVLAARSEASYLILGDKLRENTVLKPSSLNEVGLPIVLPSNGPGAEDVSYLGDINADGYDDLAIARQGIGPSGWSVHIFPGSPTVGTVATDASDMLSTDGFVLQLPIPSDALVRLTIGSAGDFNGDGIDDFAVAGSWEVEVAPREWTTFERAFLVFGDPAIGKNGSVQFGETAKGLAINGASRVLTGGRDLNGDEWDDVVVAGADGAYVLFGNNRFETSDSVVLSELESHEAVQLPSMDEILAADFVGDVNGDGVADLAVGGVSTECPSYVFFGGTNLGADGSLRIHGDNISPGLCIDTVAQTVAGLGDANGDGIDDLVLGRLAAPEYADRFAGPSPRVHVLYGNSSWKGQVAVQTGELNGLNGYSIHSSAQAREIHVTRTGDLNTDGLADVGFSYSEVRPFFGFGDATSYVIFTPSPSRITGVGHIDQTISIDPHRATTYTVQGTIPDTIPTSLAGATTVMEPVDVSVDVRDTSNFLPGGEFSYEIELRNDGEVAASGITLSDELSSLLTDVVWERSGGNVESKRTLSELENSNIRLIDEQVADQLYARTIERSFDYNGDGVSDDLRSAVDESTLPTAPRQVQRTNYQNAGNVNGDDFDDVLVQRLSGDGFLLESFVVLGSDEWDGPIQMLSDRSNVLQFNSKKPANEPCELCYTSDLYPALDFNGDGIDDLLLSQPFHDEGRGAVHIVFGHEGISSFQLEQINGSNGFSLIGDRRYLFDSSLFQIRSGDTFGERVMAIGDRNGDGFDDFIASASRCGVMVADQFIHCHLGSVDLTYLVLGGPTTDQQPGQVRDTLDIPAETSVIYRVRGQLLEEISADFDSTRIEVLTSERQLDPDVSNNVVTISSQPALGDIDNDGVAGFSDFLILQENFGRRNAKLQDGDLNADGIVDFHDFLILSHNYRRHRFVSFG